MPRIYDENGNYADIQFAIVSRPKGAYLSSPATTRKIVRVGERCGRVYRYPDNPGVPEWARRLTEWAKTVELPCFVSTC